MKKKIIFGLMLCVLGIGAVILKVKEKPDNEVFLQYGDSFSSVSCVALNNEKEKKNSAQKYKIVFYIDPYCESCIKSFTVAERMSSILSEDISVNILWRQRPSTNIEKKAGVPSDNQYVLDNIKLSNPYPTYFILDDKDEIVLMTDNVEKVMKKILSFEDISKEHIIDRTNSYLSVKVEGNNKPILIYFAMEGCPDCEKAEEMLWDNHIQEKYNILTVYTEESYGEHEYVDVSNVFGIIYDIEWYPSFLILEQDEYKFVGENTLEDLKQILL
ncbi:thioredoxin family protein [Faecalicatena contorta]|uniref:Thioredoxin-like domain-containing protein n=1 Tax=Faecalicatena contorta TaxID=39482 RepID=A0A315ZWU1_9FIRM|nr:thioredoxin family protein [Faecalicatena contorta]PWJ49769.1 thioredoxin-like protein [Faecalicatena contorta]SUQ14487.1 Thioredoxin-like domain-containing protein [Faecalicatena contorta]